MAALTDRIAVVGLGTVGLALAVAFDDVGHDVVGYDIDRQRLDSLRSGVDPTDAVRRDRLDQSTVTFTDDESRLAAVEYLLVTVQTPVDQANRPDLSYLKRALRTVGEQLSTGTTVVLESTMFPGGTEEIVVPLLEAVSGLTAGDEFFVGYSPERMSPGDPERGLTEVTKVVAARTDHTRADLAGLYGRILEAPVYQAPSIEAAEAAKCIENIQRDVNIALMNEFAAALNHLNVDTRAALEVAATKWNFHEYHPGLVDGHCTPVDPYYFLTRAEQHGYSPELIRTARRVNEAVPQRLAETVSEAVSARARTDPDDPTGEPTRVLVLGLAYKPETRDVRGRATPTFIAELRRRGFDLVGFDPLVDADAARAAFGIELREELTFEAVDVLVVKTAHDAFDDLDVEAVCREMNPSPAVVDLPGLFDPETAARCGAIYREP